MQGEDDLRGLAKIMAFMRAVSILLVLMHLYWFCYGFFLERGWTLEIINKILGNFQRTAGLFSHTLYIKAFALVLLALSCLGTKGVKNEKITWTKIYVALGFGFVLFFLNTPLLKLPPVIGTFLYIFTISLGYIALLMAGVWMSRLLRTNLMDDVFNNENESFQQETKLMENEYSVNLPTKFYYKSKWNNGWINIVNPFRASIVLGTPGSGKSYAIVNNYIKQQIEKGFSMYIYDFKFDDLSTIAYNHLLKHRDKYKVQPKFYVINFDDPRKSHRCNPLNKKYSDVFTILTSYSDLENYLSPFMDAWQGGAQDQLQGQIASAKIPLSRMISPQLYWVMTGDDFTLDINNPKEPKILCVGNNPDRQNIYSAALGLYNSRIVKLINKKGQLKSSVIIDELPTIYFRGLDNLIATARSNKVAVCLGFQDFSQLTRDYGDKESKVIQNTVGNIFSGQVVGETAKSLSERFGKVLQKRQSMTINRNDKSTSISTQLDSLIPASKISTLTQGMFVGSVSDNFDERIDQKIFHAEIVVDNEKVAAETKVYEKIPEILSFVNEYGEDKMKQEIESNYRQIKSDILHIVESELERIKNDPNLQHLIQEG